MSYHASNLCNKAGVSQRAGQTGARIAGHRFFDPAGFVNFEDHWGKLGTNPERSGAKKFDFALAKSIRLRERPTGELRWEAFEAFNQPTFSNPNSTLPAAGPGS